MCTFTRISVTRWCTGGNVCSLGPVPGRLTLPRSRRFLGLNLYNNAMEGAVRISRCNYSVYRVWSPHVHVC